MTESPKIDWKNVSPDVSLKQFWGDNERFADLFNAYFYGGEMVVKPETLRKMDTDVSMSIFSKEFQKTIKRGRDVLKISEDGKCYCIMGIENQQAIHYAMPLRCMVYDVLTYLHQVQEIARKHKELKDYSTPDEFLSGWNKEDRLIPCYTIVIYWGERLWDGPRNLADMVQFGPEDRRKAFKDYPMELICVNELLDYNLHNEDVYKLFTAVNALYKTGGRKLPDILSDVNVELAYTASVITGTTKQYGKLIEDAIRERKESINLCEAVKKVLIEERIEGREETKREISLKMLKKGYAYEDIADINSVSVEQVKAWEQEASEAV